MLERGRRYRERDLLIACHIHDSLEFALARRSHHVILEAYVGLCHEANRDLVEAVDCDDYDYHYVHYARFGRREKPLAS